MKTRTNGPCIVVALLILLLLDSHISSALSQVTSNISVTVIHHTLISLEAGTNRSTPMNLLSTNFGTYTYGDTESISDSAFAASGSVSQEGVVMLQSNILYVTGSASASGIVGIDSSDPSGECLSTLLSRSQINFTLAAPSCFIFQASATLDPPIFSVYPNFVSDSFVSFEGAMSNMSEQTITFGEVNGLSVPSSGYLSGILSSGSGGILTAPVSLSVYVNNEDDPLTEFSQFASLSYSLTIYPTNLSLGFSSSAGTGAGFSPSLTSSFDGSNIVLSWPISFPNCILTSTTDLNSTNWTVVPTPPTIRGGQWEVSRAISAGAQFFRLWEQ